MNKVALRAGWMLGSAAALGALWEMVGRQSDSLLLPSAMETAAALARLVTTRELWEALWLSNQALLVGFPLALAGGVARMRTNERTARLGGRKRDALPHSPLALQALEEVLQRHAVETDVMRAQPEIDEAESRIAARDARQIAEAERASDSKRRRAEALNRIGQIATLEREAARCEETLRVGLSRVGASARFRRRERSPHSVC